MLLAENILKKIFTLASITVRWCAVTAGERRRTSTLYGTVPGPITVKTVYNSHRH